MKRRARIVTLLVFTGGLFFPRLAASQEATPQEAASLTWDHPITIEGLGTIDFPVTTRSEAAHRAFVRGVLLLHVFHYRQAAEAFREAERLDSKLAMAYWGEALTHTHAVWGQYDRAAGRAALARLAATPAERQALAPTAREKAYLNAVEILYADGPRARRFADYADAMGRLSTAHPKDDEARAFYAIALLGRSEGVRDVPTYMRAAAIADGVFARNPNHPGAAHYLIHAVDDPLHAVLGLRAARALSRIAPAAAHAQHMTSHIFMALGMWDDVVAANEAATRSSARAREAGGRKPTHCGHYNFWLEYGYLQQGRFSPARQLLEGCYRQTFAAPPDRDALDPDESVLGSFVQMWARYLLDTEEWDGEVAGWKFDVGDALYPELTVEFVRGMRAGHMRDAAGAQEALAAFREAAAALPARLAAEGARPDPQFVLFQTRLKVLELEMRALEGTVEGGATPGSEADASAAAIELLRQADSTEGEMPFSFGPPFVDKPAAELLGEVLLKAGRGEEAAAAFRTALERTPGRSAAVRGLARAAEVTGEAATK